MSLAKVIKRFFIIFFIFFSHQCVAKDKDFSCINFKNTNQISSGIVSLRFDKDDFLWLSTQTGICRFDGTRFHEFNKYDCDHLTANRYSLILDNLIFLGDDNKYCCLTKDKTPKRISSKHAVFKNFVFTSQNDKYTFLKKNAKLLYHIKKINKNKKLTDYSVFYSSSRNEAYITDIFNLYYYKDNQIKLISKEVINEVNCGLFNGYFYNYNITSKKTSLYFNGKKVNFNFLINHNFKYLLKNSLNEIQFLKLTISKKLYFLQGQKLYELKQFNKTTYKPILLYENLKIKNPTDMDVNEKFNIHVFSSFSDGLYVVKQNRFKTIHDSRSENYTSYASSPLIGNKILLSNGRIYDLKKSTFLKEKMWSKNENCLAILNNSNAIWFSTVDSLFCLQNKSTIYRESILSFDKNIGQIKCIHRDFNNRIWFNTGTRLVKLNNVYKTEQIIQLQLELNEIIETFILINYHKFLIGTTKGLYEYNSKSKKQKKIIFNSDVRNIYKDKFGFFWISTYGNGPWLWDGLTLRKVPVDANKHLIFCHSFLLDKNLNFWISTNNGLFTINRDQLIQQVTEEAEVLTNFNRYTVHDGLEGNEFNGGCSPCSYQFETNFYFPSMQGLVQFNPSKFTSNIKNVNLYTNSIYVDNIKHKENDIKLSPGFNRLYIDFSIPYWSNKNALKLMYFLEGSKNPKWITIRNDERLSFSNLGHGSYKLKLKLLDSEGKLLGTKKILFIVLPNYYETSFFKSMAFLLILIVIYLLYRLRLNFLLKEKMRLQKMVSKQVEELNESNKNLQDTLNKLSESSKKLELTNNIRSKLVSIFIHDLKSPMRFLSMITQKMITNRELMDKVALTNVCMDLNENSNVINRYIDNFLIWQSLCQDGWKTKIEEVDLQSCFNELQKDYSQICQINGNNLTFTQENLSIITDKEMLKIIIRNLIDNANKHTNSGEIRICATKKKNSIILCVSDNGNGMELSTIKNIRSILTENSLGKTHNHIGYQIIGEFIKVLGAEISLNSSKIGTTVTIEFKK